MGGQLIKGYSIQGQSLCHTGLSKSWKLYKGHKSSTQVAASIFLIEKKHLKKQEKEELIKFTKKQSTNLLRVRHPGVLAIIQPLTEDENILAFVSERVEGNISLLIKQNKFQEFIASQLELKLFLYPFVETITFIHDILKQAHLAISLDNIFVTQQGKWKLAGFGHNHPLMSDELAAFEEKSYDLSFSAPELALQQSYCKKSDLFSLGVVILRLVQFIHKSYKPVASCSSKGEYESSLKDTKNVSSHPIIAKSSNPAQLSQFLTALLNWNPAQRCNLSEVLFSKWMNDSTLVTVKYLDKISNYESKQQLDFLKGLAGVLDDFPLRVVNRIVIPKLLDLLKYSHLIASIVYIIIDLLKKNKIEDQTFKKQVWPELKTITQGKQMTAQAIYLLVLHIQIFQKVVSETETSAHLMPLYLKCYDCPPKLKQLALAMLQKISKKVDYAFLKTKIMPKLLGLLKDPSIQIRKDALKGINSILHLLDTQTVSLSILPSIEGARKAGSDGFVNAITMHIYKRLGDSLPVQIISTKILPTLVPYLTEPSINRSEFLSFKGLIIKMIDRIQKESSKQFDSNSLQNLEQTYTEADFKFKETDIQTAETKKGDYNFLTSYLEAKPDPQVSAATTTQQLSTAPVTSQQPIQPAFGSEIPSLGTNNYVSPQLIANSTQPNAYSLPQTSGYIAPQLNLPSGNVQIPSYNFDSLNSSFPNTFFSNSVQPRQQTQNVKIQENKMNFNTDIFENMVVADPPKKIQSPQATEKQQSMIPKPVESQNIQKVSQQYTPPSPPKDQKPKKKFIGGASGPMEIKKLVGPPGKLQKQSMSAGPPVASFAKEKQESIFSMNFDSYSNPGINVVEPLDKKNLPSLDGKFDFGSSLFSGPSTSSNPFQEIERDDSKFKEQLFTGKIKIAPAAVGSKPPAGQSSDIYSYFQSEQKPKQQSTVSGSKNAFDLI